MYRLWYYFYLVIQVKGAAVIETEANLKFTRLLIVYKVCNNTPMKYTRWAFVQNGDIFTCDNNMLSPHVKRSLIAMAT